MSLKAKALARAGAHSSSHRKVSVLLLLPALVFLLVAAVEGAPENKGGTLNGSGAKDPGVRGGAPGAGTPIAGLTTNQLAFFNAGLTNFELIDSVTGSIGGTGNGLGPRFNAESCAQCHAQPAVGGTSPSTQSADCRRHRSGCGQSGSVVHHAQRSGARGALSLHLQRPG